MHPRQPSHQAKPYVAMLSSLTPPLATLLPAPARGARTWPAGAAAPALRCLPVYTCGLLLASLPIPLSISVTDRVEFEDLPASTLKTLALGFSSFGVVSANIFSYVVRLNQSTYRVNFPPEFIEMWSAKEGEMTPKRTRKGMLFRSFRVADRAS